MSALLEAVKVALGETYSAGELRQLRKDNLGFYYQPPILHADVTKASRLARMHIEGPEFPVTCDHHNVFQRSDIWNACAKVPVREALMGHVCGQP